MTTEASIGYGTVLEIALASAPTAFTYIREVFDATPPNETDDTVDATHFQSEGRTREFIPGFSDGGEASFEMNYVPGSATDLFLRSIKGVSVIARLTFANGVRISFAATRQGYEPAAPNDDKMTATLTLKVAGVPTQSAAAAPRNLVLPTISGTEEVGEVLTALPGQWAGAQSFTYQWQADTAGNGTFANISGATNPTFVLTSGQEGDDVRVVVTAANASAFTTDANSAETGAIAA